MCYAHQIIIRTGAAVFQRLPFFATLSTMLNILKVQIARKRFRKNQANAENTFFEMG